MSDALIPSPRPTPPAVVYAARTALNATWMCVPAARTKALLLYAERGDLERELRRIVRDCGWPERLWAEWFTVTPLDFGDACRLNTRIMDEHATPDPAQRRPT